MVAKLAPQPRGRRAARPTPTILELRLRDLSRLRAGRYGEVMPDTPDTRRLVAIIAQHMATMPHGRPLQDVPSWISLYAPWSTPAQTATLIADALNVPKFWKAHELAWALKLTAADRKALRITTIGACDMSPAQRAKLRKECAKQRNADIRREKGALTRAQYLAKERAKPKPWLAAGISRRTWNRRQA